MKVSDNNFASGLISGLTSGGTSGSIPGVFFVGMITGVGHGTRPFPLLLPCTRLFLGLNSASVVIRKFLFREGGIRGRYSWFAIVFGKRE